MARRSGLILWASAMLGGCAPETDCTNEVLRRLPAPDVVREAVVFRRSCGATTGDSLHIWVGRTGQWPHDGQGNALVADAPGQDLPPAAVRWAGPSILRLTLPDTLRVFRRDTPIDGVQIEIQSASGQ